MLNYVLEMSKASTACVSAPSQPQSPVASQPRSKTKFICSYSFFIIHSQHICSSIGDVITALRPNLCDDTFGFVVRREHVLNDTLLQMDGLSYSPYKEMDVCYLNVECDKWAWFLYVFRLNF